MKNLLYSLLMLLTLNLFSCSYESDHFKIELRPDEGQAWIYMRPPIVGLVNIGEETYDCDKCRNYEEELFDAIRNNSYDGDYKVYVCYQTEDKYGNKVWEKTGSYICTLNAADVKKYADYEHFKGSLHPEPANEVESESCDSSSIFSPHDFTVPEEYQKFKAKGPEFKFVNK